MITTTRTDPFAAEPTQVDVTESGLVIRLYGGTGADLIERMRETARRHGFEHVEEGG